MAAAAAASAADEASSSKIRTLYIVLGLLAVVVLIFITLMLARKHSASNISSTPSASETYGTEMVNFGSGKAQSTLDTVELANSMVPSFQMHGTASRAVLTAAPLRDRPSGLRVETASNSFEPSSKSRASPPHTPSFEPSFGVEETALGSRPIKRNVTLEDDSILVHEESRSPRSTSDVANFLTQVLAPSSPLGNPRKVSNYFFVSIEPTSFFSVVACNIAIAIVFIFFYIHFSSLIIWKHCLLILY